MSESTGCVYVKSGPSFKRQLCVFCQWKLRCRSRQLDSVFPHQQRQRKISVGHVCVSLCLKAWRTHTSLMKLVHLLKHELHGYQDWHRTTSLAKAMLDVDLMWPRVC